ncbi:MAG TPA: hypothetical protein VFO65_06750 [Acidimicrobiales bacterium]|nr:hypothetical protein [Acidimicrobiales bacterium]
MRILYIAASGRSDPTRASIPWHLAVNGSVEVGQETGIVLAGESVELMLPEVLAGLEGVGLPPARDLVAKARQHDVPVYV